MSGRSEVNFNDIEVLQQVTDWIAQGYTEASVAKTLGYSATHFSGLKRKYPELAEAIKNGRRTVEQLVQDKFWSMMFDDDHPKQFSALVFYAKCKLGWSESRPDVQDAPKTTGLTFKPLKAANGSGD